MAATVSANLYAPDVWADAAAAQFKGNLVVGNSSAVVTRDDLEGTPGSTVNFPRFEALNELDKLTEGQAMDTEELTQTSSQATIIEAGKAVELTDKAMLTGIGNAQDEAIRQFGILAARHVDKSLINVALDTVTEGITNKKTGAKSDSKPLEATISGALSWASLTDALTVFGDDYEPSEYAGLFISSAQRAQVWKDADFIRASEMSAGGAGSIVNRGLIGSIAGLPVFTTDRLPAGKAAVLKQNSLGLFWKRRPIVEQDRDVLKRADVVTTNMHYAVKRLNDRGVLAITLS